MRLSRYSRRYRSTKRILMRRAARVQSVRLQRLLRRRLQKRSRGCLKHLVPCRRRLLFLREGLRLLLLRQCPQKRSRRCLKHLVWCRKRLLFLRVRLWGLKSLRTSGVEFRTHHPTYIEVTFSLRDVAADLFFERFGGRPAHLCAETTQERQGERCVFVEIDRVEVEQVRFDGKRIGAEGRAIAYVGDRVEGLA